MTLKNMLSCSVLNSRCRFQSGTLYFDPGQECEHSLTLLIMMLTKLFSSIAASSLQLWDVLLLLAPSDTPSDTRAVSD
jgi:hypothetical protein